MPRLPVLTIPHPRLKQPSLTADPHTPATCQLITDLIETVHAHPFCVGIAAPQTGFLQRIVIIDLTRGRKPQPNHGLLVMVNPVIHCATGTLSGREGCLSVPDLTGNVTRAEQIEIHAVDRQGTPFTLQTGGFEAIVIQHELDHLNGILFLDRVTSLKTDVFRRK
jgi:peptide deformylase